MNLAIIINVPELGMVHSSQSRGIMISSRTGHELMSRNG